MIYTRLIFRNVRKDCSSTNICRAVCHDILEFFAVLCARTFGTFRREFSPC